MVQNSRQTVAKFATVANVGQRKHLRENFLYIGLNSARHKKLEKDVRDSVRTIVH
jgi:hypothetical protein